MHANTAQVRMLGRQATDVANISAIGRQKPADGEPGAGVKKKFIEGITFPFTVWKNIKAPRWSVLCKGEVLPLPASMGNSDMFVATHDATGSRYFARMVRLQDVPARLGVFRELDALLRLRTRLSQQRAEANRIRHRRMSQHLATLKERSSWLGHTHKQGSSRDLRRAGSAASLARTNAAAAALSPDDAVYNHLYMAMSSVSIHASRPPMLVMLYEGEDVGQSLLMNLEQLSFAHTGRVMPEPVAAAVIHQVLQALAPIHAADMVHGSVDASAVYICSSGCVRLGNLVHSQHADSAECRGKLTNMAPERLFGIEHTHKSDVWAVGMMLARMLVAHADPLGQKTDWFAYKRTIATLSGESGSGEDTSSVGTSRHASTASHSNHLPAGEEPVGGFPALFNLVPANSLSASARVFVTRCLDRNPNKRPSVLDCLAMPFAGRSPEASGQVAWAESKTAKAILAAWLVSVQTSARESGGSRPASSASSASNGV